MPFRLVLATDCSEADESDGEMKVATITLFAILDVLVHAPLHGSRDGPLVTSVDGVRGGPWTHL